MAVGIYFLYISGTVKGNNIQTRIGINCDSGLTIILAASIAIELKLIFVNNPTYRHGA